MNTLRNIAFTLTIKPKYHKRSVALLYESIFIRTKELLNNIATSWYYVIEFHKSGIPHVHGYFQPHSSFVGRIKKLESLQMKLNRYVDNNFEIFGYGQYKYMDDYNGWVQYLHKDMETTIDYLKECLGMDQTTPLISYSRTQYYDDLNESLKNHGLILKYQNTNTFNPICDGIQETIQ